MEEYFRHDKFDVTDIEGTQVDTYGRRGKQYAVRDNNLDYRDVNGASPNKFPGNVYKNKPDLRYETRDLDYSLKNQFSTNRVVDPLNPTYQFQTRSRRHIINFGKIDGNSPMTNKSPNTKRKTNLVDDISGAKARDLGSIPHANR